MFLTSVDKQFDTSRIKNTLESFIALQIYGG